jgi:hypothetical protein
MVNKIISSEKLTRRAKMNNLHLEKDFKKTERRLITSLLIVILLIVVISIGLVFSINKISTSDEDLAYKILKPLILIIVTTWVFYGLVILTKTFKEEYKIMKLLREDYEIFLKNLKIKKSKK